MSDFIYTLAAVFIGGIITLLVSKYYYKSASKDLKGEVSKLKKLSNMILRVMEDEGWVKLNIDKQGNIQGFVRKLSGSANIKFEAHGNLSDASKKTKEPKNNNENKTSTQP